MTIKLQDIYGLAKTDIIPAGGTTGQVLIKQSATNGDADWRSIGTVISGTNEPVDTAGNDGDMYYELTDQLGVEVIKHQYLKMAGRWVMLGQYVKPLPKVIIAADSLTGYLANGVAIGDEIFFAPGTATKFAVLNVRTGSVNTFGTVAPLKVGATVKEAYGGFVLANNGKIYATPIMATQITEVDPVAKTVRHFGSPNVINPGRSNYVGAVLGNDGKVYAAATANTTQVMVIDPTNDSISYLTGGGANQYQWGGIAKGADGKLYMVPYVVDNHQFGSVDTTTGSITKFGSRINGFIGVIAHPDGYLYGVPNTHRGIAKIDPSGPSVTIIQTGVTGCAEGCVAPNGKIYLSPAKGNNWYEYDPITDTLNTISTAGSGYRGLCIGSDSNLYATPESAAHTAKVINVT